MSGPCRLCLTQGRPTGFLVHVTEVLHMRTKLPDTREGDAAEVRDVERSIDRKAWVAPKIIELPRLTDITLQSPIPGFGNPGDGSTVF